jgi:hypothetical protein
MHKDGFDPLDPLLVQVIPCSAPRWSFLVAAKLYLMDLLSFPYPPSYWRFLLMLPWSLVGLALVCLEKLDGFCGFVVFLMKNSYEQL